jgi:hypothetical protein
MMKKAVIALVAIVAVVAIYLVLGSRRSPKDTVSFKNGAFEASVVYCRPYKKARVIFGPESSGALVPDGKYWRLGANAATQIALPQGALFAGQPVAAGTYRMYAVPGPEKWKVVLNSELGNWGTQAVDHQKDVLSVEVPVEKAPASVEQFTISFQPDPPEMRFAWDTTLVRIPIGAK